MNSYLAAARVVASSEFQRLLSFIRNYGFIIEKIDERSLPYDNHADRLVGYKIRGRRGKNNDEGMGN